VRINTELFLIKPGGTYSNHSTLTVQITGNSRIANSYITPAVHIYIDYPSNYTAGTNIGFRKKSCNKYIKVWKCREKLPLSHEISRKILFGIRQYKSILPALPDAAR
jgi:hypothetical protein